MSRYLVYGADRAGCTWDVGIYHEPLTTLWVLEAQRLLNPHNLYGVCDHDNPENGDCQLDLEELLAFDVQYLSFDETINAAVAAGRQK
jgi:hypothetical protein